MTLPLFIVVLHQRHRWVLFVHIATVLGAGLSPSSGRWQSSQWWQTTCGPWYHWLHSWGCQSAWSGPPAASFSTDPSGLSWSGMESEPVNGKSVSVSILKPSFFYLMQCFFLFYKRETAGLWPPAVCINKILSVVLWSVWSTLTFRPQMLNLDVIHLVVTRFVCTLPLSFDLPPPPCLHDCLTLVVLISITAAQSHPTSHKPFFCLTF